MISSKMTNKTLELRIYGFIGKGWFADVSAETLNRHIENYKGVEEINVRIHSAGGSIAEGCAIYNTLKNHPAKVKVYIEGECCSIATVIAMAGDEIVMSPVANFMIHNPLVMYMSGGAEDLRHQADVLDTLKETIINAYMTKTKLNREEISEMMDKESWFKADEALKYGFITEVQELGTVNSGIIKPISYENIPEGYFNINIKNKGDDITMPDLKNITLEQLKAENPELVNKITAMERERIKAIDMWTNKTVGAEKVLHKYKYDEPKNASEIMEELLNYVGIQKEESSEEGLAYKFEQNKQDAQNSGSDKLGDFEKDIVDKKKEESFIQSVVNMANGEGE